MFLSDGFKWLGRRLDIGYKMVVWPQGNTNSTFITMVMGNTI